MNKTFPHVPLIPTQPVGMQPLKGASFTVSEYCILPISFEQDFVPDVRFFVVNSCSCDILLGLEFIQLLGITLNHKEHVFSLQWKNHVIRLDLLTPAQCVDEDTDD